IANILENPLTIKSVRCWCTLLAMAFPDNTLIKGLNISLQSDDEDTRDMAMLSLKMITSVSGLATIKHAFFSTIIQMKITITI
ncbi:hypothetical protein NQU32_24870, partial [Escherichia coli]|nr:hypothetical protein [Escherichia coli]